MSRFYVYAHRRLDTGNIFYIGKGTGRRALTKGGRSALWTRIASKHGYRVELLIAGLTEAQAFAMECHFIAKTPDLCNHTDGGEGISGYQHTQAAKDALRAAHAGKKQDAGVIERRTAKLRGQKRTPEQLVNFKGMAGRTHSAETKARMSAAHKGRVHSPEALAKIAESHRGSKRTDESRARMRDASAVKKAVICVDTGTEHVSLQAAAEWLRSNGFPKATRTGVWYSASGQRERSYGLKWAYSCPC